MKISIHQRLTAEQVKALRAHSLAVIPIQNVDLVDKPFGETSNSLFDYLDAMNFDFTPSVITADPAPARAVVAGDLVDYPASALTVNDLIMAVRTGGIPITSLTNALADVIAYRVLAKFEQNAVAASFSLLIQHYAAIAGTTFAEINREIIVTPSGGGNSSYEFVVIPQRPSQNLRYTTASAQYTASEVQRQSFMMPQPVRMADSTLYTLDGAPASIIFVLRDQALIPQKVTVQPVFRTESNVAMLAEFLAAYAG
jgi:hypothetical protein